MGLSYRKSIKLGKNVKLNLSKSGPSLSFGPKGAKININKHGTRTTLRKDGLQYTKYHKWDNTNKTVHKESPVFIEKPIKPIKATKDTKITKAAKPIKTTNKLVELSKKYRECPIDNKQDKIKLPKTIWKEFITTGLLVIATIFFIPMAVFAFISGVVALVTLLLNKQCWAQNYQCKAIRAYHFRNNQSCIEYCKKSLKKKEYESTRKLLELAQQEVS